MSGFPRDRRLEILNRQDCERIHWGTLEVLQKTGVKVASRRGLELLREAGCEVDAKSEVARVPGYLVDEALSRTAKSILLAARDPKWDARLDHDHVHVANDGNGTNAVDFETGVRRLSTQKDLANSAILSDAMEVLHIYWPMVSSQDVPTEQIHLTDLRVSFNHTTKHVQFETGVTVPDARQLIRMATIVAGGEKELRRRPLVSSVHCTIAPLMHDEGVTDSAFEFGTVGIPCAFFGMPQPGATGPMTIAGSLVVSNAEVLSGIVMAQLANPGAPLLYGTGCAPLDMQACTRAGGGPEHGLASAAATELAHFYGMPSLVAGFVGTAKEPGPQAAIEKFTSGMLPFLAGADIMCGVGLLEDCRTLYLEELMIEEEIVKILHRISRGIEVTEETLALDLIQKVGIQRDYLAQRHTMAHLKTEMFIPTIIDRRAHETWAKEGRETLLARAHARAAEILQTHEPPRLPPDIDRQLGAIVQEGAKASASAPSRRGRRAAEAAA